MLYQLSLTFNTQHTSGTIAWC